jgi:hypothetical protein
MTQFQTRDAFSDQARANIAADLANLYAELGKKKPAEKFSVTRVLNSMAKQEFHRGSSYEAGLCEAAAISQGGSHNPQSIVIPWGVLGQRDLTVGTNSAGGYLAGSKTVEASDVLRPFSLATRLGITILESGQCNHWAVAGDRKHRHHRNQRGDQRLVRQTQNSRSPHQGQPAIHDPGCRF